MASTTGQPGATGHSQRQGQEFSNAPGSFDLDFDPVGWQAPAPLPDVPTIDDLRKSLDFAHHNIEALRMQVQAQGKLNAQQ